MSERSTECRLKHRPPGLLLSDHLSQAAGPGQAGRLEEFKRRSQTFVIGCLQEAKQSGALSAEITPEASAVIVLGSVLSLSHTSTRIAGAARIEQLSEEVWSAIERTLRAPRPVLRTLAWARIGPDLIFGAGALLLLAFVGRAIWLSRGRKA
jgi:nitric oxide reductase large subunit